jgi:hypothetical protein
LFGWACDGETSTAQFKKVFLLLFVHKKKPSSSLKLTHPKGNINALGGNVMTAVTEAQLDVQLKMRSGELSG